MKVTIGLATQYRMDIWDTAWTLAPGHRLRLWLSSSDSPNHEPLATAGRKPDPAQRGLSEPADPRY